MWPPAADLLAAWHRLVADPDTAGAFAALVLHPLETALAHAPARDPADRATAAADAVLAFLRRPAAFDPARSPLHAYLGVIAHRRLYSLHDRERRHHAGRIPWDCVELPPAGGNEWEEAESLTDDPAVRAAVDALSAEDRCVCDLMCGGEKDNAVYAAVLGVSDRPTSERDRIVKRAKDRIKVRLKRAVEVS